MIYAKLKNSDEVKIVWSFGDDGTYYLLSLESGGSAAVEVPTKHNEDEILIVDQNKFIVENKKG